MSRINTILLRNVNGMAVPPDAPVPALNVTTSDVVVVAPPSVGGVAQGDGVNPQDVVVTASADQNGTIFVWQGSDLRDFAGLPGTQPVNTLVRETVILVVAGVPVSQTIPFEDGVIAVQYINGAVPAAELRLAAFIRYA